MSIDAARAIGGRLACLALAATLVACGAPSASSPASARSTPPASTAPSVAPPSGSAGPSASAGPTAADDLAVLLETLERSHPEPFHAVTREHFVAALDAYEAELPELSPDEAVVGLMRVLALLSREGRDGHQFAFPTEEHEGPVLPIRVYEFAEGLFVTDALPPHEEIVGARITAIEDTPIEEVLAAVEPLVPRDGPATVPSFRPILLLRTQVLRGLGIVGDGAVTDGLELPGGRATTARFDPIPLDDTRTGPVRSA